MERHEYPTMFNVEDRLWRYRGLRLYFQQALGRARLPEDALVLDAGCGTGANLARLFKGFPHAVGCDLAPEAMAFCASRGLKRVLLADVNHLPFRIGAFDCVLSSDILGARQVDERGALGELARVTRVGGRVVVSVSAHEFLRSRHDDAFHTVRRYTKRHFRRAVSGHRLEIVGMRYLFGFLFLPMLGYRVLERVLRRGEPAGPPRSDLFLPSPLVNAAMLGVVKLEAALSRIGSLPFGITLLVELERI